MAATTSPPRTAQIGRLQADIGQKAYSAHRAPCTQSTRRVSWTDDDARRRLRVVFVVLLVVSAAAHFLPPFFWAGS